jgi:hypothetical protein
VGEEDAALEPGVGGCAGDALEARDELFRDRLRSEIADQLRVVDLAGDRPRVDDGLLLLWRLVERHGCERFRHVVRAAVVTRRGGDGGGARSLSRSQGEGTG